MCVQSVAAVASEPSVADWWMVWVTVGSVLVSGVLAWLAYWNGRRATRIAEEASARDEKYRERGLAQRDRDERAQVALSMMRALIAAERLARADVTWQTTAAHLEAEYETRLAEALAQIDVYAISEDDVEMHVWFESAMAATVKPREDPVSRVNFGSHVYETRVGIVLWNQRSVTPSELIVGELPRRTAYAVAPDNPDAS